MPDLATLALFAAAALALCATPGPDMLLIASRSVSQGKASGFATLAGIQVGTYCHALAAALGLSQLFLVVPVAYDVVRYAGAAYLLYLAWQAFRSPGVLQAPAAGTRRYPIGVVFRQGLLTNLLNPKMALFVLALFPQFIDPAAGSIALQIMVLATVINLIGIVVNGAVILTASSLGRAFTARTRWRRVPQLLLGTVFAGLAVRLAFDDRRWMPTSSEYAVFTEFSPDSKLMTPGWNRRVFTDTDARKGDAIQCDFATGIVTLAPGAYHITGLSMVAYTTGKEPPETTSIQSPASAGYCRLRRFDPAVAANPASLRELPNSNPAIISIGSPTTANLSPSLFETFYETDETAQILLEHQSGSKPDQIYLRVFVQNSKWHAFARISIRGL